MLYEVITADLSAFYAKKQIEHGVEAFQLFETHANLVPVELYNELFMPAVKKISRAVRETGTPFIFFPKGIATGRITSYNVCYTKLLRTKAEELATRYNGKALPFNQMMEGIHDAEIIVSSVATKEPLFDAATLKPHLNGLV